MNETSNETYEAIILPCSVDIDGTWVTERGDRVSVVGTIFDTPDGTEWADEEIRFVTRAAEHIETCPSCDEWVGNSAAMLEAVSHRVFPCCACGLFVWLPRPPFEDDFGEANA